MRIAILLFATAAVAGCVDQEPAATIRVGLRQSSACEAAIARDPRYAPIAVHMPLTGAPATDYQLTDLSRPTADLAAPLADWHDAIRRCRLITLATVSDTAPAAEPSIQAAYVASDRVLDELAAGRLNWGEANQRRDAIALETASGLRVVARTESSGVPGEPSIMVASADTSGDGPSPFWSAVGQFAGDALITILEGVVDAAGSRGGGVHGGHVRAQEPHVAAARPISLHRADHP